eukprot:Skav232696  [mRNA]  locus=scaffold860:99402:100073:- [translate_table: standard]
MTSTPLMWSRPLPIPRISCQTTSVPDSFALPWRSHQLAAIWILMSSNGARTSQWATHEFHWVYSSAGAKDRVLTGGLGGVFARDLNPAVLVRGQVVRIVNDPSEEYMQFNTTWLPVHDYMLYIGSTTSDSYNNEQCSPFEVTWWVDRQCKELSAQVMDRTCKDLLEFGIDMENDVKPASSRQIVAPFISDTNA